MLRRSVCLCSSTFRHFPVPGSHLLHENVVRRKPYSTRPLQQQQHQQHQQRPVRTLLKEEDQHESSTTGDDLFVLDDSNSSPLAATPSSSHYQDAVGGARSARCIAATRVPQDDDNDSSSSADFKRVTGVDPDTDLARDISGNVCHVPKDSVQFVADEFRRLREIEVLRRKKILAELATPNPADYTFDGKLVPMPPLNFGTLAQQSHVLAEEMIEKPNFSCVRQSTANDVFFEINDYYIECAFVGRANAGKSSLINAVLGQPALAKSSSTPGSTRTVNFYQAVSAEQLTKFRRQQPNRLAKLPGGGLQFTLVDVPGFGLDGMSDSWRDDAIRLTDSYLGQRRSLNTLFMCIDAVAGVTPTDERYFQWISKLHGVFWVVLTKCDAVPHTRLCMLMNYIYERITSLNRAESQARALRRMDPTATITGPVADARKNSARTRKEKYHKIYPLVIPVSARTGANVDFLRALMVETSGVMPANTLRHLLQRQRGAKWNEAVAEEMERRAEAERMRAAALEEVQLELARSKGFSVGKPRLQLQQQQQQLLLGEQNGDDDDDDETPLQHNDDVLSFEIPSAYDVSDGRGDIADEAANSRIDTMAFKLTPAAGLQSRVAVPKSSSNKSGSGPSSSSPFAQELAQKLAAKSNGGGNGGIDGKNNNNKSAASSFKNKSRSATGGAGSGGSRSVLVEQPDGALVDTSTAIRREQQQQRDEQRLQSKLRNMSRKERAAYARYSGGTGVTGEAVVDHAVRQMEVGQAQLPARPGGMTLRQKAQADVTNASRLAPGAMPPGLWRQYASANEGRPNAPTSSSSRVLGW